MFQLTNAIGWRAMITRRRVILVGAVVLAALIGMQFATTYLHSRSAGELAGTLTWARKNSCLRQWHRTEMLRLVQTLESDEKWWRDPFNAGFVASNASLNAAAVAIGQRKACELYIAAYEEGIELGSVKAGIWSFRIPDEPVRPAEPERPLPSVAKERLESCRYYRDLLLRNNIISPAAEDVYCQKQEAQLAAALGPPPAGNWDAMPKLAAVVRHGIVRRRDGHAVAPFKILTSAGSNYFFKLLRLGTNEEEMAGFIEGGRVVETNVPSGTYELRYAVGGVWISEQEYFGPNTSFAKAESPLTFSIEGDRARGVEVQLVAKLGGNLRTSPIKRIDF